MTFQNNWQFSEKHMPAVRRILAKHAMRFLKIETATMDEDMKQAFDLKITTERGNVAVRIRRGDCNYRDLTIRAYNKGLRTELHKLRDGFGDWYLYAWENANGVITEYALIDVNKARPLFSDNRQIKMNTDGVTGFTIYTFDELIKVGALVAYER